MAVLVITINDPVFDKKSAEVAHLQRTLQLLANVIGRGQAPSRREQSSEQIRQGSQNTSLNGDSTQWD
jgi:hypothetical protein